MKDSHNKLKDVDYFHNFSFKNIDVSYFRGKSKNSERNDVKNNHIYKSFGKNIRFSLIKL